MIRIRSSDRNILPRVNMLTKGPTKTKPIKIPVHRAHKGNWIPFQKKERSASWWHLKSLPKKLIAFFHLRNCCSVILKTRGYRTYIFLRSWIRFCLLLRKEAPEFRKARIRSRRLLHQSFGKLESLQNEYW